MLLRDLIDLPDSVTRGDFVLSLDSGVRDAEGTLKNYVVTPQLVKHFDEALTFIKAGLEGKKSRGTYLDGSFGSGKSHFMAVLHFLLQGELKARTIPELAKVVTKHDSWLQGKKFLLVPYHMIGATSLESAVLGGYVHHVKTQHPEAPTPAVYRAQELIENAQKLLGQMGTKAFFAELNKNKAGGSDGWGALEAEWTEESFQAAVKSGPTSDDYRRLAGDLIDAFFQAIRKQGEFIRIDEGLSVISRHAKDLGYDALVLFLDEMILWLASKAGNFDFISSEVPKVSKLVESEKSDRPVPLISFIARQRDLRELIGHSVTGAQNLNFADQLKFWEGRFGKIKLEDTNLPFIAEKRVLRVKSDEARRAIDDEFERTAAVREEVMRVLLTSHSNRDAFRRLYPFSPALVETLVAVSSLLQRERTALKIMLQLLVDQKDVFQLGELVPVGDLYDQIAQGDEAFSADMKRHFDTAHRLYRQHLRPLLEDDHGLTFEEAEKLDYSDPKRDALRNDDRLVKTLLLSALAPEVESLRNLTPAKMAALNHGTIKSPIPGQEANIVFGKVQKWAGRVGQIKISGGTAQPIIAIQLTGVDVDAILDKADAQDNFGNRIRLLKKTLFERLEIQDTDEIWIEHKFRWRGTDRRCKVFFLNVWEADFETFDEPGDEWKVVIDFPIDRDNRGPQDDRAQLARYREERGSARTLVWLPSFFSAGAQQELGTLVRLEHVLSENRFPDFVRDLSPVDRESARGILTNKRDALRQRLIAHMQAAYGLQMDSSGSLDPARSLAPEDHFQSLASDLELGVPGAPHFAPAFVELLHQAMDSQYPGHPKFDHDLRLTKGSVQKVLDVVTETLRTKERRLHVEKSDRSIVRQIANPLKLGEMGETHFVIGERWKDHFNRTAAKEGVLDAIKVPQLLQWTDEPDPMGLPDLLRQLAILTYAQQTNRSFSLHGGTYDAKLGDLPEECNLRQLALPSDEDWAKAAEIGQSVLGIKIPTFVSGQNVARLSVNIKEASECLLAPARELDKALRDAAGLFGCDDQKFPRARSAREGLQLLNAIRKEADGALVKALANLKLESPLEAIGSSLKKAPDVTRAVSEADLTAVKSAADLPGVEGETGRRLRDELKQAFQADEYAIAFAPKLLEVNRRSVELLTTAVKKRATPPADSPPPPEPPSESPPLGPRPKPKEHDLIREWKKSQVAGDPVPDGLDEEVVQKVLRVVEVEGGSQTERLVVTLNLARLIEDDPGARYDKKTGQLSLPACNLTLKVSSTTANPVGD